MSIGERLKEERERLGLSQAALGTLGGVQKQAQLKYEKGERFPDARYLVALAENGLDVTYVLTGKRVCEGQETTRSNALLRDIEPMTPTSTNVVVPLPRDDESGLTQQEVLDLVLDALHVAKRTLPAVRIHAVVDAIMAWQRAGAAVTEASIADQLRMVK